MKCYLPAVFEFVLAFPQSIIEGETGHSVHTCRINSLIYVSVYRFTTRVVLLSAPKLALFLNK